MGISAISSTNNSYSHIASGKRIQSAADDAAGLAIAKKLESISNSYDVGADNASAGKDMVNVADGALSSITDSLQRMRELSIQASNTAVYSDSDIAHMQDEIDQLKQQISDTASNTQFNTKKLLDGSNPPFNIAANPDGSGTQVTMPDSTLNALGISGYDVTGSFDISKLDDALEMVSSARSSLGAQSNGLDHMINYNRVASEQLVGAQSRIEDLDYPKAISDQKKEETLQTYQLMMQKRREEEEQNKLKLFQFS